MLSQPSGGSGSYEMVRIPGGSFMMGSTDGEDNEKPVHEVTISSFMMGKYEVTQGLYEEVMGSNPSKFEFSCGSDCPVEQVSWCNAVYFANRLSEKEGLEAVYSLPSGFGMGLDYDKCNALSPKVSQNLSKNGYRLPTEAEWEYAAKAGGELKYAGSNDLGEVAWYGSYVWDSSSSSWVKGSKEGNSGDRTHSTGQKKANAFGLYDMSGNVWEWTWDWYGEYAAPGSTDPVGASRGSDRVLRGGGWYGYASILRSASRNSNDPGYSYSGLGFRLSRSVP